MDNSCLIYISNLITGDVQLSIPLLNFKSAKNHIPNVVNWYIEQYCKGFDTQILQKESFNENKILNDKSFPNGFVFKRHKSSVKIYKKTSDVGWLSTDVDLKLIACIGINFFEIPISQKIKSSSKNIHKLDKINIIKPSSISENLSLEHGRHVSFIEELKSVIKTKDNNKDIKITKKPIINHIHKKFISDLVKTKNILNPVQTKVKSLNDMLNVFQNQN